MAFGRKRKAKQEQDSGFAQQQGAAEPQRIRLTPVDIQQRVFRLAFRGYNEQDVDQFLDEITEDLAALHEENKRLREELELRGPGGGAEEARRHAEEIIRRAREQAAQITAAAPAAVASDASVAATPAFLVREREFLQRMASLVQDHAATLKAEARRAREASEPEPEEAESELEASEEPAAPEPEPAAPEASLGHTAPMPAPDEGAIAPQSNPFEGPEAEKQEEIFEEEDSSPAEEEPSLRELFWGEE